MGHGRLGERPALHRAGTVRPGRSSGRRRARAAFAATGGWNVRSVLSGERYAYAPVSDLYLFGRPQDLALQARDNIHQRNHLRLWLSPMRYHGKQVWVGQISRDIDEFRL
jgi:hypothetical protein